jgi:hypothetical protein
MKRKYFKKLNEGWSPYLNEDVIWSDSLGYQQQLSSLKKVRRSIGYIIFLNKKCDCIRCAYVKPERLINISFKGYPEASLNTLFEYPLEN